MTWSRPKPKQADEETDSQSDFGSAEPDCDPAPNGFASEDEDPFGQAA